MSNAIFVLNSSVIFLAFRFSLAIAIVKILLNAVLKDEDNKYCVDCDAKVKILFSFIFQLVNRDILVV